MKMPSPAVFLVLVLAGCPTAKQAAKAPPHFDGHFDGDAQALAIAARYLPSQPVILEAGAYHGETSLEMVKRWPQATVYSFEPVPELLAIVKKNTAAFPNIHVSGLALSEKIGTAVFHMSAMEGKPDESLGSGSLLEPSHHREGFPWVKFDKTITVNTTTIDAWAQQSGVAKIDFIWLDIQGTEFQVLKAAPNIMKTVKVVITEVEFVEMYKEQTLFAEMKPWFEAQGFALVAADFAPDAPSRADLNSRKPLSWYGNALFARK
jgi:FkbM family methyltransferase